MAVGVCATSASAAYPGADGKIAFQHDAYTDPAPDSIYTVEPDGSDLTRLTTGMHPSWSADGTRIVFERNIDLTRWIFTMNAVGGDVRRVRRGSLASFSPGGRRILYSIPGRDAIASVRADGTGYREIARNAGQAQFAPHGRRIAFVDGSLGISIMRRDGSHRRRVAEPPRDGYYAAPDWRPDGRRILAARCTARCHPEVMRPDGSHLHRVCGLDQASYAPSGRRVAWPKLFGLFPDYKGSNIWWSRPGDPSCTSHRITHFNQEPGYHFATDPSWQPLLEG